MGPARRPNAPPSIHGRGSMAHRASTRSGRRLDLLRINPGASCSVILASLVGSNSCDHKAGLRCGGLLRQPLRTTRLLNNRRHPPHTWTSPRPLAPGPHIPIVTSILGEHSVVSLSGGSLDKNRISGVHCPGDRVRWDTPSVTWRHSIDLQRIIGLIILATLLLGLLAGILVQF